MDAGVASVCVGQKGVCAGYEGSEYSQETGLRLSKIYQNEPFRSAAPQSTFLGGGKT